MKATFPIIYNIYNKLKNKIMKLTKEQILGILRHVLTFGGGILVTKGILDEAAWEVISGSSITLVGSIWSVIEKNKA
jgi:hypothetical protein